MGLSNLIRNGVAIANRLTTDLQVSITHYAWIGQGATYGEPLYSTPITRTAIVELKQRMIRIPGGEDIWQKASVTFLEPIAANGAAGRREPIDPRDKIVLPDGYTGPIRDVIGLANNFADSPYMIEVILG